MSADDSRYDQERYVPTWKPGYREDLDVGPVGALVVDQGVTMASGRPALVDDPARQAAEELAGLLRARGVTVGDVSRGAPPSDAVAVGSVTSQPLRTIVGYMLAVSDNLAAEMLTKELGARLRNEGSTTAGVAAVHDALARLGVPIGGAADRRRIRARPWQSAHLRRPRRRARPRRPRGPTACCTTCSRATRGRAATGPCGPRAATSTT